jgi:predicted nucleic acid-binding protein
VAATSPGKTQTFQMIAAFLDTNVFLDFFLRRGNAAAAETILSLGYQKKIQLYTSTGPLLQVLYFLRKDGFDNESIRELITHLLSFIRLAVCTEDDFLQALASPFTDQEDAVHYYTALHIKGIDYFITANIKDFKKAERKLPVVTPDRFLKLIQ